MTAAAAPRNIVAAGAGRMGRGIAQVFAYAGHGVTLIDLKERSAKARAALFAEALDEIKANLQLFPYTTLFRSRKSVV